MMAFFIPKTARIVILPIMEMIFALHILGALLGVVVRRVIHQVAVAVVAVVEVAAVVVVINQHNN